MRRLPARGSRSDRGSMAVEIVLLTPVLMAFVILVVAFGRYVAVRGDIDAAARDGARAASLQTSQGAGSAAARRTITASLDDDTTCSTINVGGEWGPGGEVVVQMTCRVDLSGLGLVGVPGSVTVEADSAVPLDPYRSYQ